MRKVTVAATQMSCTDNIDINIEKADRLVREAKAKGADIILLQELFETPYFCQKEKPEYYEYALDLDANKAVEHFSRLAAELKVVLPISFYEKSNYARYNSLAMIDADGTVLGVYRKSHIILILEIQVFRCLIRNMASWEPASAGISGFRRLPDVWF